MEIKSKELKEAQEVFSMAQKPNQLFDVDVLRNDLKTFILSKDKALVRLYDFGSLHHSNTTSGTGVIRDLIKIIRDEMVNKYKDDTMRNLTIRKVFDTLLTMLECLTIQGIDLDAAQVNSLIIGYISRNLK